MLSQLKDLELKDPRPPANQKVRKWIERITGISIPALCDPIPESSFWKAVDLRVGCVGDHRAEELTTIPIAPVVIPARPAIYRLMLAECSQIDIDRPKIILPRSGLIDRGSALKMLLEGSLVLLQSEIPSAWEELRVNAGNPAATGLATAQSIVEMKEGRWPEARLDPETREMSWKKFLLLSNHVGAYFWTQIVDPGCVARNTKIDELDDSNAAVVSALHSTRVAPVSRGGLGQRLTFFHPFATRMHSVKCYEYRQQISGFALVLVLTWLTPSEVTTEMRRHRAEAISNRTWVNVCYSSDVSYKRGGNPVSTWSKAVVGPGHLLLLPPDSFVIEYSSGSGMATEGIFLPWAGLSRLTRLSAIPDMFILKAMMLTAREDFRAGRATETDVKELVALLAGKRLKPVSAGKSASTQLDDFERTVDARCVAFSRGGVNALPDA